MPTAFLSFDGIPCGTMDVLADRTPGSDFVRHVGLSAISHQLLRANMDVELIHMRPGLVNSAFKPEIWAGIRLTTDEISMMQVFRDRLVAEYDDQKIRPREQYCVLPKPTGRGDQFVTTRTEQFSCSTFVLKAYQIAEISLLNMQSIPLTDLDELMRGYPTHRLDNTNRRSMAGLTGEGPWPVPLPGHVVHSLARSNDEVRNHPYHPQPSDSAYR